MKKLTFITFFLMIVAAANAQEFKPFKVDLSTGYAIPSGEGAKGGVLMVVEPKYAVIPNLSVGVRFEIAVMARGYVNSQGTNGEIDLKASGSYLATTDYYYPLPSKKIRPFSGAGTGIFSLASATADNNNAGVSAAKSKFGGMARSGVEIGHFRLAFEYNFVGDTDVMDASNTKIGTSKNSYMSIKIGATIGGGRIK